jgi:hypothetical protein
VRDYLRTRKIAVSISLVLAGVLSQLTLMDANAASTGYFAITSSTVDSNAVSRISATVQLQEDNGIYGSYTVCRNSSGITVFRLDYQRIPMTAVFYSEMNVTSIKLNSFSESVSANSGRYASRMRFDLSFASIWKRTETCTAQTVITDRFGADKVVDSRSVSLVNPKVAAAAPAPAPIPTLMNTPVPSVSGLPKLGNSLTANAGSWDSGVTLSFQWLRNGSVISGATSSSYVLQNADVGNSISLKVTGSKSGYANVSKTSQATQTVTAMSFSLTPAPQISGSLKVDSVLTATANGWESGVTLAFQWYRGTSKLQGMTGQTYRLTGMDVGSSMRVSVTASKPGYTTVTLDSAPTAVLALLPITGLKTPIVIGLPIPGESLTLDVGPWPAGATLTYRWDADGTPISGATAGSLVVTESLIDKSITAVVTGQISGFASTYITSKPVIVTVIKEFSKAINPKILGEARVGKTMSVTLPSFEAGTLVSLQWFRSGVPIPGATKKTFKLSAKDKGKVLKVEASLSKAGYLDAILASANSAKVK